MVSFTDVFTRKVKQMLTDKLFMDTVVKDMEWEIIDLRVTPQTLRPTKNFEVISRVIWFVKFQAQTTDLDLFGVETALDPGIQMKFNSKELLDQRITMNSDFWKYGYDVDIPSDGQGATAKNVLSARWTFSRSVPGGLNVRTKNRLLEFVIDEDLSSSNIEIVVAVQGYVF